MKNMPKRRKIYQEVINYVLVKEKDLNNGCLRLEFASLTPERTVKITGFAPMACNNLKFWWQCHDVELYHAGVASV